MWPKSSRPAAKFSVGKIVIFHYPQTIVSPHVSLSYITRLYWVASPTMLRQLRLGPAYSAVISYRLGTLLLKFEGVYLPGTHDVLRADEGKQVPSHAVWRH